MYNWYVRKQVAHNEITTACVTELVSAKVGTIEKRAVRAVLCSKFNGEKINEIFSHFENLFTAERHECRETEEMDGNESLNDARDRTISVPPENPNASKE